jgi:hypothetical protein
MVGENFDQDPGPCRSQAGLDSRLRMVAVWRGDCKLQHVFERRTGLRRWRLWWVPNWGGEFRGSLTMEPLPPHPSFDKP